MNPALGVRIQPPALAGPASFAGGIREEGENNHWRPGGDTLGDIPEAFIDANQSGKSRSPLTVTLVGRSTSNSLFLMKKSTNLVYVGVNFSRPLDGSSR
jgi:hypothetical protein